jgi:hypothetical protein
MRILVTGSRELTDRNLVWDRLSRFAPARQIIVVCGYDPETKLPKGADEFAYEWTLSRKWATPECYPADWDRKCDQNCYHRPKFRTVEEVLVPYCPMAGYVRNQEMVDSGIDYTLGFLKRGARNRGTRDCLRRARWAKSPIEMFWEQA